MTKTYLLCKFKDGASFCANISDATVKEVMELDMSRYDDVYIEVK